MSDLIITLLLDSFLAVLLMVTISYCSRLSKRIRLLQDSRGELATMITQFDTATMKASASLGELQTTSKRIIDALQLKIDKANFLADDLAFLIEKSSKLAVQLEQAKETRAPSQPASASRPRPFFETHAPAEKSTEKVKRATDRLASYNNSYTGTYPHSGSNTIPSLEAVLQRLAAGSSSESAPAFIPSPSASQKPAPRTDAERQLLGALKSDR